VKAGDLVTLSSYGKRVKRTGWVKEGDVGIIKKVRGVMCGETYIILWAQSIRRPAVSHSYPTRGGIWDWSHLFDRRDLKFVNKAKK
jgi:hypothetical protein